MTSASTFAVRAATADDERQVLALLAASLQWVPDELFAQFFAWKHRAGPFGTSPAWVAVDGDRIVGFRTFLRWEFEADDGRTRRAVRAVDTATHPDYQGRGIFRTLTLHALAELRADGVDFVFNTPNDKSRPGYLTMGWREVGRVPTAVRPVSVAGAVRMLRSRVPADRWSAGGEQGLPAAEVLADDRISGLRPALAKTGIRTRRGSDYLRWRYGFGALGYRAVVLDGDVRNGVAVFRRRRRGRAVEAALCDVLVPRDAPGNARRLERAVAAACAADYVVKLGGPLADGAGFVRLPRQGPVLTWRALNQSDAPTAWRLALGDVELF